MSSLLVTPIVFSCASAFAVSSAVRLLISSLVLRWSSGTAKGYGKAIPAPRIPSTHYPGSCAVAAARRRQASRPLLASRARPPRESSLRLRLSLNTRPTPAHALALSRAQTHACCHSHCSVRPRPASVRSVDAHCWRRITACPLPTARKQTTVGSAPLCETHEHSRVNKPSQHTSTTRHLRHSKSNTAHSPFYSSIRRPARFTRIPITSTFTLSDFDALKA